MNTEERIRKLLTSSNLPASEITHPLSEIGGGNMLDGLRTFYDYAYVEGAKKYFILGGVAVTIVLGTVHVGIRTTKHIKTKIEEYQKHKEDGEKIYNALNNEVNNNPETIVSEEK